MSCTCFVSNVLPMLFCIYFYCMGSDFVQMNFMRTVKTTPKGADASALKSDLHFWGSAYHFSTIMCLHSGAIFMVLMKFILT